MVVAVDEDMDERDWKDDRKREEIRDQNENEKEEEEKERTTSTSAFIFSGSEILLIT